MSIKCNKCGKECRIGTEEVGVDSRNLPVIHRFSYCDQCNTKTDLDFKKPKEELKLKESGFGIAGLVFSFLTASGIFAIVSLVLCLIGLTRKDKKSVCGIIGIVICFLILFGNIDWNVDSDDLSANENIKIEESSFEENESAKKTEEIISSSEVLENETELYSLDEKEYIEVPFENELDEFLNSEFHYILKEDLVKYHANLEGQNFYTIISIDKVEDNIIRASLDDGYMMSTFNCKNDYSSILKTDDKVAIAGTISKYNDYGFAGKSIEFSNCIVFSKDDCDSYEKDISDEYFKQYFTVTEQVAKSNQEITEEEFINLCEKLDYEDILRNPDLYKDKYCEIQGSVSQIIEGWFGSYTIYIKDYSGNTWGCTYSYSEGESHVLEGDSIIAYGTCDGTSTSKTVLGKQITMPYVKIEYIK